MFFLVALLHLLVLTSSVFVSLRITALRAFFQSLVHAEDIIKVHEARLTEKETSSLDVSELKDYSTTLRVRSKFKEIRIHHYIPDDQPQPKCHVCVPCRT